MYPRGRVRAPVGGVSNSKITIVGVIQKGEKSMCRDKYKNKGMIQKRAGQKIENLRSTSQ